MAKFRLEPKAEISATVTGGEELRLTFDSKGIVEIRDDFQEAITVLEANPAVKRVRESK